WLSGDRRLVVTDGFREAQIGERDLSQVGQRPSAVRLRAPPFFAEAAAGAAIISDQVEDGQPLVQLGGTVAPAIESLRRLEGGVELVHLRVGLADELRHAAIARRLGSHGAELAQRLVRALL